MLEQNQRNDYETRDNLLQEEFQEVNQEIEKLNAKSTAQESKIREEKRKKNQLKVSLVHHRVLLEEPERRGGEESRLPSSSETYSLI